MLEFGSGKQKRGMGECRRVVEMIGNMISDGRVNIEDWCRRQPHPDFRDEEETNKLWRNTIRKMGEPFPVWHVRWRPLVANFCFKRLGVT